jgi:predicted deacylase
LAVLSLLSTKESRVGWLPLTDSWIDIHWQGVPNMKSLSKNPIFPTPGTHSSPGSPTSYFLTALLGLLVVTPVLAEARLHRGDAEFQSHDGAITFSSDFPGGRMSQCTQISDNTFAITIAPESDPINDSAWYAFRIQSAQPQTIRVLLHYVGGSHRYEPKTSRDGETWVPASELLASTSNSLQDVELQIPVDSKPLWIAGQELLSTDEVSQWASRLTKLPHVERKSVGRSVQGRSVDELTITQATQPDYVYIIARQHPPEVTGAIGMMHFVDTLAGSSELAEQFRKRFATLVVPTVNPDGVHHGHWRCNANGVDLNRDWSHFTQPESRAIRDRLLECRRAGEDRLCLFVDFHSTYDDVFYIPAPNDRIFPAGFTQQWFSSIQARFPGYNVSVDANHNAHRSTSKAWVDRTLGVTAVTYEFGDETDRETIKSVANGAAEEMMRLLLDLPQNKAILLAESNKPSTNPAINQPSGKKPQVIEPEIRLVSGVEDGEVLELR